MATGIRVPWGLARLPDGAVLVSARDSYQIFAANLGSGAVTLLGAVAGAVSNVSQAGEGGLLGIAVSPAFTDDRLVYVYFSTASDNRIATVTYDPSKATGQQLGPPKVLVSGIPHNVHHNGGRLGFGPDGFLYATTGEAENAALAQDKGSLGRQDPADDHGGEAGAGQPVRDAGVDLRSSQRPGHRVGPGRAVVGVRVRRQAGRRAQPHRAGQELRLAGDPGPHVQSGYTSPVAQWGTDEDSPSGIAYAAGCVWMAALKGQRLWRIPLNGAALVADPQPFLVGQFGRLRSVLAVDDHTLLVTTSNRDGRTTPRSGDDRLVLLTVT